MNTYIKQIKYATEVSLATDSVACEKQIWKPEVLILLYNISLA